MLNNVQPFSQDLVLVGGGHSHAIALQMWAMQPLPGVRVTVVSDRTHTPYSGMLPGHVAGFYNYDECHIDLRRLCEAAGAQFYLDRATGLDLSNQRLHCANHPGIYFDWLSLDIGSTPAVITVPGAQDYAIPAKPVPEFLAAWEDFIAQVQQQPDRFAHGSLGIVGGGAGGVELASSMGARLCQIIPVPGIQLSIHLFHRGAELLPGHAPSVQRTFKRVLQDQGVTVHLNSEVVAVVGTNSRSSVRAEIQAPDQEQDQDQDQGQRPGQPSESVVCDRLFWVTQASAPTWLGESGLQTDESGFVLVGDTLQSLSHPHILAAGDIATMVNHPRPKAGVFAVRQGRPLFENLQRLLQGQSPQPFIPQKNLLALIGTGDGRAVASRGSWGAGPWQLLWIWKDWIDRRFMERFSGDLGKFSNDPQSPTQPMYCNGCGSKVGSGALERVLARIDQEGHPGPNDRPDDGPNDGPEDAAVLQIPENRVLIQTVDYFPALVSDPFVFGQITANHCLNDIFAMGAQPHSALAIAQIPHGGEAQIEETLYQLLSGAIQVLHQTQTVLVGGHTTEGDRLAFGLSCNGLGESDKLWRKGGIQPQQALILTKAIGTGTLFAAQRQGKAKGRWIDGAIATMLQSNAAAVPILQAHGTTACTDITGFGLLGHLWEMVRASGVSVTLDVSAVPLLSGVAATLQAGLFSSIHGQNQSLADAHWVADWVVATAKNSLPGNTAGPQLLLSTPQTQALFDPQTAGGLLAAVPFHQAEACLTALRQAGYQHSQIVGKSQITLAIPPSSPPEAAPSPCIQLQNAD